MKTQPHSNKRWAGVHCFSKELGIVSVVALLGGGMLVANDVVPPKEVEQLIVDASGDDVVLGWQVVTEDVTGVSETGISYRVFATTNDPTFVTGTEIGVAGAATFGDTGKFAAADTNDYFYLVAAVDDNGVQGNLQAPAVLPAPVISVQYENGTAEVSWLPQPEASGYRVFWGTSLAYENAQDVPETATSSQIGGLASDTTHSFTVFSIDDAGNLSAFVGEASLELTGASPPGITATPNPSPNEHGWNNTAVTVDFTCTGGGPGGEIEPVSSIKSAGFVNQLTPFANVVDDDPTLTTKADCTYNVSNSCGSDFLFDGGTVSGQARATIGDDGSSTVDETVASYSVDGGQIWHEFGSVGTTCCSSEQIATVETDPLAGVDLTLFRVRIEGRDTGGSGGDQAQVYDLDFIADQVMCPDPVPILTEGAGQIVTGMATGASGSSAVSVVVNLDMTGPVITPSATPPANAAGWNNSPVSVEFACLEDSLSPIAACSEPILVVDEGEGLLISGIGRDLAGNTSQADVLVSIDLTNPAVAITDPASGAVLSDNEVAVSGSITEANTVTTVVCNGSPGTVTNDTYSCVVTLEEDGLHTILVEALDIADNLGENSAAIEIDTVAPAVSITDPEPLQVFGATMPVVHVSGTIDDPSALVTVNGESASVQGSVFTTVAPISLHEGNNFLTSVAIDAAGNSGTSSIRVILDTTPPVVTIDCPAPGIVTDRLNIGVAGMIHDIVVGTVNSGEATVVLSVESLDTPGGPTVEEYAGVAVANRSFLAYVNLEEGRNVITATGEDAAGNPGEPYSITVTREASTDGPRISLVAGDGQSPVTIGDELPVPLQVVLRDEFGVPVSGEVVVFRVIENSGEVRCLPDTPGGPADCTISTQPSGRSVAVTTDSNGEAHAYWKLGTRAGAGNQVVEARAVGFAGTVTFTASAIPETCDPVGNGCRVRADSGQLQAGVVGQPLPAPFVVIVTDSGGNRVADVPVTFTVTEGGGSFLVPDGEEFRNDPFVVVPTNSDGYATAILHLGQFEQFGRNEVEATIVGSDDRAMFEAKGMADGDPAETQVSGVVLDNTDTPVAGATMRIGSIETTTGADGRFVLESVPVGNVHLEADGSTVDPVHPERWPHLEFELVTVPGRDNTLGMPVYLLPLSEDYLYVDENIGGELTLTEVPGFLLEVEQGSVTFPGGETSGTVSVTMVHADKVPMTPNAGQQPRLVITIQPAGAVFDPPARLTVPNVDGLAPGSITELYSFDHDLGQFVSIGTATVSDDATQVRSDPGVGIVKAGWHWPADTIPPETYVVEVDRGEYEDVPACDFELRWDTPKDSWACTGGVAEFRVETMHGTGVEMHYQWFIDQEPTGTDSPVLVVPVAAGASDRVVWARVWSTAVGCVGFADTRRARLTIGEMLPDPETVTVHLLGERPTTETLWWFEGEDALFYSESLPIKADRATPAIANNLRYEVIEGHDHVTVESDTSRVLVAQQPSLEEGDVTVTIRLLDSDHPGNEADACEYVTEVRTPWKWIFERVINVPPGAVQGTAHAAWVRRYEYEAIDQFGTPLPEAYEIETNEQFCVDEADCPPSEFPVDDDLLPSQLSPECNGESDWMANDCFVSGDGCSSSFAPDEVYDVISADKRWTCPVPFELEDIDDPDFFLPVHGFAGRWRMGSSEVGKGVVVTSDFWGGDVCTWKRFRGTGCHLGTDGSCLCNEDDPTCAP